MNYLTIEQFPDIRHGSISEDGNIVHTLTIPAEPQYNETVVECVAVYLDGSPTEVSPPATILFFTPTVSLPEITHFETTPTNTLPDITESPTNTPPGIMEKQLMCNCSHSFELPPSSPPGTTNFMIIPSPLTVAVEQGTATFQCQHPLAISIGWRGRVNGILQNVANLPNISTATPNNVTILSIATLLVYNGITVECIASFIDGSSPQFTPLVQLLIQGICNNYYAPSNNNIISVSNSRADTPKQVENATYLRDYSKDELTIMWNPLPTLDINDTDPDILYTVELYRITCGQNILINRTEVAGSNVTEEGLDLMHIYKAVIAARNNVRGARNGPTAEIKGTIL